MFNAHRPARAAVRGLARRSISYTLPSIPLLDALKASREPLAGLYSAKALDDLWFQRGQQLTDKLNSQLEQHSVKNAPADLTQLVASTVHKPDMGQICAHASMLHNLQFCLESLKANSAGTVAKADETALLQSPSTATRFSNEPTDEQLREWLEDSFGSIAEFRTLLLNSCRAIKGDGITWLVAQATYSDASLRDANEVTYSKLAVVNTYNAGIVDDSIRSGQVTKLRQQKAAREQAAAKRHQERAEIEGEVEPVVEVEEQSTTLGSVQEAEEALAYSDKKLLPLLAVDGSMRAYLEDYGVFGKAQYLENVWDCIDWSVVASRAPQRFKPSVVFDY